MLAAYLRRALELPPHLVLARAGYHARRLLAQRLRRQHDMRTATFVKSGTSNLVPRLALGADQVPAGLAAQLPELTRRYLDHRFDLLGSGWVKVYHGLTAAGVEGHRFPPAPVVSADMAGNWLAGQVTRANLPEAQRLWCLIDGPYWPIDWQIDFKSGFRWDSRRHFSDLTFGSITGADVKVPWELARLQHLPQLAIAFVLAKAGRPGFDDAARYAAEVRNQIVDFLAANPPRFGVNWLCPMDVGIRIANILLAVDLLRAGGATIDPPFGEAVANAAVAHARHILANLEWSTMPRSNHYLSDVAGVLFCALYLPASDETDAWLDFAAQQFDEEILDQFLADGGNFEGSTNYHRLSAELALFSVAALLGVSCERAQAFDSRARRRLHVRPPLDETKATYRADAPLPLSDCAIARLERAVACVAGWSKPDGRPPQIGDTDSGRLFKLHPLLRQGWDGEIHEDLLHHGALLSAGHALFENAPAVWQSSEPSMDAQIVAALSGGRTLTAAAPGPREPLINNSVTLSQFVAQIRMLPPGSRREQSLDLQGLAPSTFHSHCYRDFGLFVLRNDETYVSLRCVERYIDRYTMGHYHDDNLAIEIHHRGEDLITDPGSYLYTPVPEMRERYRGAGAHFVPRPEGWAAARAISPFTMRFDAVARCVYFGQDGVAAELEGPGWKAFRAMVIEDERLTIIDGSSLGALANWRPVAVSDGYGRLTHRMSVALAATFDPKPPREPQGNVQ